MKIVKLLSSSVLVVALSLPLFSDSVDIGFKSYHYAKHAYYMKEYKYNENNLGVIYNFNNGFGLGYLHKNSVNEHSYIIKYNFFEWLSIGLNHGNYSKEYNYTKDGVSRVTKLSQYDTVPFVALEYRFLNYYKFSIMPPTKEGCGVIYFGLSFDL